MTDKKKNWEIKNQKNFQNNYPGVLLRKNSFEYVKLIFIGILLNLFKIKFPESLFLVLFFFLNKIFVKTLLDFSYLPYFH